MPYDIRPGESPEAYRAFCLYRDTDVLLRSVGRVEVELGREVGHWVGQFDWVERVDYWDDEQRREATSIRQDHFRRQELRQFRALEKLQTLTEVSLECWEDVQINGKSEIDPIMELKECRLTMDSLVKLTRLMSDRATDIVESKNQLKKDLTKLSIEELKELKRLNNKVKDYE